jgi:acetyl esterase/lipase
MSLVNRTPFSGCIPKKVPAGLLKVTVVLAFLLCISRGDARSAEPVLIKLWSGVAPGEQRELPPEADITKPTDGMVAGTKVIRLGNVSEPTLTIYRPTPERETGAAVLVCPGGGYNILAMDLEGTETCEWLNSIGVTAALLKYRVPRREGRQPSDAPLQDAQRAINVLRFRASEWGIDPKRIGCLGYSAGANLSTMLSTKFASVTYPKADGADELTPRPDFTMLIYPAYLVSNEDRTKLAPDVVFPKDMPQVFMTMAQDDPLGCENVFVPAMELNKLKIPVSLHLYPTGGHGYGLRRTSNPSSQWTDRAEEWLKSRELLLRR